MNPTMPSTQSLQAETRRHFFSQCSMGIGSMALSSLLAGGRLGEASGATSGNAMAPRIAHFPARVKSVIYLFMAGGPS